MSRLLKCYDDWCYAEFHYAQCRYAECRYAECRSAILFTTVYAKCLKMMPDFVHRYRILLSVMCIQV